MKCKLELTRGQQMALTDIIIFYIRQKAEPQVFVNCSQQEDNETTSGELLQLVTDAKYD